MNSAEQILSALVPKLGHASDDRVYAYLDGDTERSFAIRRSENLDELGKPYFQYFLEEYTPNGRMVTCDKRGNVTQAWDEPLIQETEQRVGPNSLMQSLRAAGLNTQQMVSVGGGYGVGSIFYSSLEECAKAISASLTSNTRYHYHRELTPQEKVKLERQSAQGAHAFWTAEAQNADRAAASGPDLFKGCYTLMGAPLNGEVQALILAYLNGPSQEGWRALRGISVVGATTLWQAWCQHDANAPRAGDTGFPDAETLISAIRHAVTARRAEIDRKLKDTTPSGLKRIK